ncbi:DNA replication protein DnaD [Anaerobacillus arseniciselenatis]|uniref:DNA replication protein DnaD n=1 Tax=Anaerobacillus arseniciselenatis TaxID=85682 RepID=A0A1S2LUC7_9BACI|nr:DnaD domain-containing protein [Anaerobacillus arseniciselenatis]OIJ15810.1 DNA replication protein DnaD [Anaerobacillus arseniciselenatis]
MDRDIMINWINEGNVSIPFRLISEYRKIGLSESEVMLLIQIHSFIERGNLFPPPQLLASRMTQCEKECLQMLQSLMKRGFIELQERSDENNIYYEVFTLTPLWDKLIVMSCEEKQQEIVVSKQDEERSLYQLFEGEFGRPLSPMEFELITMWLDQEHYSPSLIKAALMEAVVSGKRNLRYIDRILIEWNKNGVKTVQQAKEYGEKFRQHQYKNVSSPQKNEPKKKIPSYNWLDN